MKYIINKCTEIFNGFTMLDQLSFSLTDEEKAQKEAIYNKLQERYRDYRDPWGFKLDTVKKALDIIYPLYLKYFKVRVFGQENIGDETYMVVSNHTGQIPIDGVLITTAFAMECVHTRILHSMIERFMAALPFLGDLSAQAGSILGDRENCKWLLDNNESILVFPEGVRGISKSTKNFYKLQKFSTGFYRIALDAQVKILPVAVVGAEDMFPFVMQASSIAKQFGLPALPLSANYVPLPSPIDIYFGEPVEVLADANREASDKVIRPEIEKIENQIKDMIKHGLENKRPFIRDIKNPIKKFLRK